MRAAIQFAAESMPAVPSPRPSHVGSASFFTDSISSAGGHDGALAANACGAKHRTTTASSFAAT